MATLPVARGAYGQPPRPPIDASSTVAPASSAARQFAYPVLRVLWPWNPSAFCRGRRAPHLLGVATPIVSARTTSARPAKRCAGSATMSGIDRALERAAEADGDRRRRGDRPRPWPRMRLGLRDRVLERHVRRWPVEALGRGERDVDAVERRLPEPFVAALVQDEAGEARSPRAAITATTSSAPAICGTRSSRTKLTASTRGSPAAARRLTSSRADGRRQRLRLVLQPVPRADVAEGYPHGKTVVGPEAAAGWPPYNVLAFPGIFRGALDVRAHAIDDAMELAAAQAIAAAIPDDELSADYIVPSVFNKKVATAVAAAVAAAYTGSAIGTSAPSARTRAPAT